MAKSMRNWMKSEERKSLGSNKGRQFILEMHKYFSKNTPALASKLYLSQKEFDESVIEWS